MRQILFLCLFFTTTVSAQGLSIKAIYGVDDREFITDSTNPKILEVARAVGIIVNTEVLVEGLLQTIIKAPTLKEAAGLCDGERFASSHSVASCTGFLISDNLMATAGHCFQRSDECETAKIIFDVTDKTQIEEGYGVSSENVYSCKDIVAHKLDEDIDYTIIRLDRRVRNRKPLKLNKAQTKDDARVFMIGHPMGLPLMWANEAEISSNEDTYIFHTSLDSFRGNSGSPVINAKTFLVEGILVSGQEDLVQDPQIECYRNMSYKGSGGEGVFRASELPVL